MYFYALTTPNHPFSVSGQCSKVLGAVLPSIVLQTIECSDGCFRSDVSSRLIAGLEHTKLSSTLPGLLEYRINFATSHQPEGDSLEPLYDGAAELWWESIEVIEASFASDLGALAGADADEFYQAASLHRRTFDCFAGLDSSIMEVVFL